MKTKRDLLAVTFICIWFSTLASMAWAKKPPAEKVLVEISLEWVNSICTNAKSAHPNCETTVRATLKTKENKAPVPGKKITFYQDNIKQPGTAKTDEDGHAVRVLKTLQGPHTAYAVFNNSDKTHYAELPNSNSISYSCWIKTGVEFDLPNPIPPCTQGEPYYYELPAPSGGTPPYHYVLDTMDIGLPMGLSVEPVNGAISGVCTSPPKKYYSFGVCAVDADGDQDCDSSRIYVVEGEYISGVYTGKCTCIPSEGVPIDWCHSQAGVPYSWSGTWVLKMEGSNNVTGFLTSANWDGEITDLEDSHPITGTITPTGQINATVFEEVADGSWYGTLSWTGTIVGGAGSGVWDWPEAREVGGAICEGTWRTD